MRMRNLGHEPCIVLCVIQVTAVSNYTNPYTATATVVINVLNPNNQPTPFQFNSYYATVYENVTDVGGTVAQVSILYVIMDMHF